MKIPGYTIIREIGKGGMAAVYLAVQESLDRQVALKVMQPTSASENGNFTERFLKEGRIIAQFQYPKIITIYDFGSHSPYHYFSMEFLSKGTLAQRIAQGLSPEYALEIIKSIAEALAYAHSRGVVHRDIKPQNILFRQDDTPVLSDFGIAKVIDADDTRLTVPGLVIGSPVYMSPEQITGKELDNRSDLYSLGVVLYEMLSRKPPYRSDNVLSIAMMHCTQPVPQLPTGVGKLQPMLQKLLAKDPAERFESADEFIDVLDHTQTKPLFYSFKDTTGDTTQTIPPVKKFLHSKKIFLAGGLLLLMMAVGSAIYSTFFRRPAQTDSEIVAVGLPPVPENRFALTANYEQLATQHFQKDEFEQSLELIKLGLNSSPNDARLLALRERVERNQIAARLLEQAQQHYRDGEIDQSLQLVEEGLWRTPDHGGLMKLRDTLQVQFQRRQQADQLLSQARARWQEGDPDSSLKAVEEGLQLVPGHSGLSALREMIQDRLGQRQRAAQLLDQARELQQRGELDESLKRIEEGLSLVSDQSELLNLRSRVRAAIEINNRVVQLLQDCATRFPLDRLSAQKGGEVVACYNQIIALAPNNSEAHVKLEQLADRYADWARSAIGQANFQLAEEYLVQLGQLRSDHPQLASLNRALQAKREQTSIETRQKIESEARRQATEEAKRRAIEEAKRRAAIAPPPEKTPANPHSRPKIPTNLVSKPEMAQPLRPSKPASEFAGQPRPKGSKSNCGEALLKAQLGEPLSITEQETCKP